ncbi:MAG TPA: cyclic nucleotide-binding domain-containing protein, partial [Gammaproteobacteria bacterium]
MVELWHISNINWLRELPEASVTALRTAATIARFEAREMIFEPSPLPRLVYILETGLVRTYRASTAGEEITFGYIHPGEVFG